MLIVMGHDGHDEALVAALLEKVAGAGATEIGVEQFGDVLEELDRRGGEALVERQLAAEAPQPAIAELVVEGEVPVPAGVRHFVCDSTDRARKDIAGADLTAGGGGGGGVAGSHVFCCSNAEPRREQVAPDEMAIFFCSWREDPAPGASTLGSE